MILLGHHYWNGKHESEKEEIILGNCFPFDDICDPEARLVIKQFLDENISNRMTLEKFKVMTTILIVFWFNELFSGS